MASYASTVLAQFDANIQAIARAPTGTALRTSGYRMTLDREPDGAVDGLYFLDLASGAPFYREYNGLDVVWQGRVNVQMGFARGGGSLGGAIGGDRREVRDAAANDCQLVAEACSNPLNYASTTTGIRTVTYVGFSRTFVGKRIEVWTAAFDVTWRSTLVTTATAAETLPSTHYGVGFSSAMLTNFERQIKRVNRVVTGTPLVRSAYRFGLSTEPDSGKDGVYYLDVTNATPKARYFGTGQSIWEGFVTAQVAFHRGGGDLGAAKGGSRRIVLDAASSDCMGVVDVCENPDNYNSDVSGIRKVVFTGFRRTADQPRAEIWDVTFQVEWESAAILVAS